MIGLSWMVLLAGLAPMGATSSSGPSVPGVEAGPGGHAAFPLQDTALAPAGVAAWLSSLPVDEGVAREMGRFTASRTVLPSDYTRALPDWIRQDIARRVQSALEGIQARGCTPSVVADYPGKGFSGLGEGAGVVEDFENSFVLTEMVACFPGTSADPESALRTYTDPEFRMEAEGRIEEIVSESGLSCVQTGGVPLLMDPSRACNRITELVEGAVASQHSQVVRGDPADRFQPIYFKESVKTFVRTPEGLALHYVNYTRTMNLGGLAKRVGRGKIEEGQRAQADLLAKRLSAGG
jgi:hypothetical protein